MVSDSARQTLAAARLYAITPDLEPDLLLALVSIWVSSGVRVVQLRHKSLGRGRLFTLAQAMNSVCQAKDALLLVNDHLDIALAAGVAGVHLGADDLSLAAARRLAGPGLVIGASAQTPAAASHAVAAGADYIGAGPAFQTPLKPQKTVIGPAGVAAVKASVSVPVFAIGGINEGNVGEVQAAGVDAVCVIRAISDPERAAAAITRLLGVLGGP